MIIALYTIAGIILLNIFFVIFAIGKPREPITPGSASLVALLNSAIAVILILAALKLH